MIASSAMNSSTAAAERCHMPTASSSIDHHERHSSDASELAAVELRAGRVGNQVDERRERRDGRRQPAAARGARPGRAARARSRGRILRFGAGAVALEEVSGSLDLGAQHTAAERSGSFASVIARTTAIRCAPAAAIAPVLWGSIPPTAKNGSSSCGTHR